MRLFNTPAQTNRYEIVYNLSPISHGLFIPTAYIVLRDKVGDLTHIQKRALVSTVGSYGLELSPVRRQLFEIIDKLQVNNLEAKFNPPRGKKRVLFHLLKDKELKNRIINLIQRELAQLLTLVVENNFPIAWDLEKRTLVKDLLLEHQKEELIPRLIFRKTKEGVRYRFRFADKKSDWAVREKDVVPIVNRPAWLFVDYKLYQLSSINANMVRPFQTKEEMLISPSAVKIYFQKFVIKQASKLDIEAEGFEVVTIKELQECQLSLMEDLFTGDLGLKVQFVYPNAVYTLKEKRKKRTSVKFGEQDEITIEHVLRDLEKEAMFMKRLRKMGLRKNSNYYLQLADNQKSRFQLLGWLQTHERQLRAAGFTLMPFKLQQKTIALAVPKMTQEVSQKNDWFDLHIKVQVGKFSIPFSKLISFIRDKNRFYPLPDGTYFLIPQEWFSKYEGLVQFGKRDKEKIRLAKSQFTLLKDLDISVEEGTNSNWQDLDFQPSIQLKATLRPYQLEGVKWLVWNYQQGLGACLADDMGLGKTLQTITVLLHAKEQKKGKIISPTPAKPQLNLFGTATDLDYLKPLNALIILPASLVFNWESELKKFAPLLQTYRHVGVKRHKDARLLVRFDVVLTTYQTALRDASILQPIDFEYIVLDESQQIKNKDSKIFKAINTFQAKHKISLSGTPIENSLSDLWSQMQFINPGHLGNFTFFKRTFLTPIERQQDEDKKERLKDLVQPFLLRRTKEQVAKDLPPLDVRIFYSEMLPEQRKLYEKEKSKARNHLLKNFQTGSFEYQNLVIRTLLRLRQIVNHPRLVFDDFEKQSGKFQDIVEQWEVIRKSGHKALLFSSFVQYLELFKSTFQQENQVFSWLTGGVTAKAREAQIRQFQNDPKVQSFLISTKAGGTGLNLTAADYVFLLDPWWNPAAEHQAIARAHRIGQTKSVFALKFITKDSIEEKILQLQERKSALAQDILDGAGKQKMTRVDLEFLLG